ncbi:VOC family protein [Couchioplanes caeruleus]|uniref:Glyoxalase n=2 Tax=Couchioplanes caeruleus TaxID=56438 RepID=A0A1K0FCD9_9ACTN|nr:VOC family protein [Couchioplanes caeruleus]OJF10511.1 glyoxalase [Couchioplanes caeruleus subsp. caeruleus]ROP28596.1 hypothetical protein EDD30_1360 [Couchioplanes caeruleus]
MPSVIRHITVNCAEPYEPYELAEFWSAVTGCPVHPEDERGDDEVGLLPAVEGGPMMLFVRVPDAKGAERNRVHVDVQPSTTRDEEYERLLQLGAKLVSDERKPDGRGWIVMADPVGNEFCVERSQAEKDEWERRQGAAQG